MEIVNCIDKTVNAYGPDPDYDDFWDIDWCENCRHEPCLCPRYIESQRGTVLWMHEDLGAMMVSLEYGQNPLDMIGQCYHEIDPDGGTDHVYQVTEYMTGPAHGCVFQVKKVGDRETLPDEKGRLKTRGWKPRITY